MKKVLGIVFVLGLQLGLIQIGQAQFLAIEKTWGGSAEDYIWAIAVEPSGNVYLAGDTKSFGAGQEDVLLLKYSLEGVLLWQRTWGGTETDLAQGVVVDPSGNVYLTGATRSFGAGDLDTLLLKYSPEGRLLWQRTWGGRAKEASPGVAVDSSGNVYVAGETHSFGAGGSDALLLKYGPDGTLLWQKTWGGTEKDVGWDVVVDPTGNVYVTGKTKSFRTLRAFRPMDVFLLKYAPDGTLLWQKTWGAVREPWPDIALDTLGNVFVTAGTMSFGAGWSDVLLLKYGPDGALLWQRTWGGRGEDYGFGVATDLSGSAYVAGKLGWDACLLKYGPNGTLLWQKTWGGPVDDWGVEEWGDDTAMDVAVGPSASIYVTGGTENPSRTFQDAAETEMTPMGIETTPNGIETRPIGTETTPTGIETEPDGSETHAGGYDAFLLVLTPVPQEKED